MGQIFIKLRRRAPLFATVGLLGVSTAGAAGETQPFFVPHAVVAAGTHVKNLAVADFSGDGTPDLAVVAGSSSHWKTDTVAVLLGLGGGAFRVGPASPAKLSAETAGDTRKSREIAGSIDCTEYIETKAVSPAANSATVTRR